MTKQEQIEQIEEVIANMEEWTAYYCDGYGYEHEAFANCSGIAEAIYNAGYRKIPENEKLKAELEVKLEKAFDHNEEECKRCMEKVETKQNLLFEEIEERVRKETAKEIFGILLECSEMVETDGQEFPFIYTENIFSLAKKYGVEVKDCDK